MSIESTVLIHEYLEQGRLVCPFGELAIEAQAHYLSVPKSKERLQAVGNVVEWIRGFADFDAATCERAAPGAGQPGMPV